MYDLNRIAFEIDETAIGNAYYGNALYVAKDIQGLSDKDKSILDSWLDGSIHSNPKTNNHIPLQEIAIKIRGFIK